MREIVFEQALIDPALYRAVDPVGADFASQFDAALRHDIFNFDVTFFAIKADLFVIEHLGHKYVLNLCFTWQAEQTVTRIMLFCKAD